MFGKKRDTTGMKDIFEEAKNDVIERINAQIAEIQSQINFLEQSKNEYDGGRGDVEDRNEINALRCDIMALEQERDKKIAELSTNNR